MEIHLLAGEMIIKTGGASHAKGIETVGGFLWLTNMRLYFKSHRINIQVHEVSWFLTDIASIEPHSFVPTWFYLHLKSGKREKLVVLQREVWLSLIQQAIFSSNSPISQTGTSLKTEYQGANQFSNENREVLNGPNISSAGNQIEPPRISESPVNIQPPMKPLYPKKTGQLHCF